MARLQGALVRRPWWLLGAIAVILLMAATMVRSSDVLQIQTPSLQGEVNQSVAQPVQPAPEVSAPTTNPVSWPLVQVEWREIRDPILPQPEEGFYDGYTGQSPTEEKIAFARTLLPHIPEDSGTLVAIARDTVNKDTVVVWISYMDDRELREAINRGEVHTVEQANAIGTAAYTYLFLSTDGGESWREITKPQIDVWGADVRVTIQNNTVNLFVSSDIWRHRWQQATLEKSLP